MVTLIFDLEATGLELTSRPWILSLIDEDESEVRSFSDHDPDLPPFRDGVEELRRADRVVAHNLIFYDWHILKNSTGVELPSEKCVDTLVLSRCGWPDRPGGHSLAAYGERFKFPKQEHDEWDRYSPAMRARCETDVRLNQKVWHKLRGMYGVMPQACAVEHAAQWLNFRMHTSGFPFDEALARKLEGELLEIKTELTRELQAIFPPILVPKGAVKTFKRPPNRNHRWHGLIEADWPVQPLELQEFSPGSRPQIAHRLMKRHGWRPRKFTPGGSPQVDETVLSEMTYPEAPKLLSYIKTEKALSFINNEPNKDGKGGGWLYHVRDGRIHAKLNMCGAQTSRATCAAPNLQQVFSDGKLEPFGLPSLRQCFKAKDGWKLVGCDAEGLELRGLSHFLQPYDDGRLIKTVTEGSQDDGSDLHTQMQHALGFYSRREVKRAVYAVIYGAGDAKLGLIQLQDAQLAGKPIRYEVLGITKTNTLSKIGKAARARLEETLSAGGLIANVKQAARERGFLRGLDGRKFRVRSLHSALNTIVQGAGAVIMKHAFVLIPEILEEKGLKYGSDYELCLMVHDEVQAMCRPEVADLVGSGMAEAITRAGVVLGFRCPLAGKYAVGDRWHETH